MCIYIHPCLFLRKQREVTGVVHIGVGFLRCSFSVVGIAKALNMERTKVRFPRFFIYLKSASNLNGNLNCSKELEHYAS